MVSYYTATGLLIFFIFLIVILFLIFETLSPYIVLAILELAM